MYTLVKSNIRIYYMQNIIVNVKIYGKMQKTKKDVGTLEMDIIFLN